ncbi:MAG: response regulator receiver [Proteobacteria bacterium]|nr:response regulator receiver [Pseudomonadota bacterium]
MASRKISAVVIDDDGVLRSLMTSILRHADVEVVGEALRAESGLELCQHHQPHLVLLDINLPETSGLALLPQVLQSCPKTRVVMVSGEATFERVNSALSQGAAGFVVKPFTSARLLDAAGRALGLIS